MDLYNSLLISFAIGVTLHNLEEAIGLPAWAKKNAKFVPFTPKPMIYWVLTSLISVFVWILVFAALKMPDNGFIANFMIGIALAFAFNAFFPHFVLNFLRQGYSPGIGTAIALNLPLGVAITFYKIGAGFKPDWTLIFAIIVGFGFITFGALYMWHWLSGSKKGDVATAPIDAPKPD